MPADFTENLSAVRSAARALLSDCRELQEMLQFLSMDPPDFDRTADMLNGMLRGIGAADFRTRIGEALFSAMVDFGAPPETMNLKSEDVRFLLKMAGILLEFPGKLGEWFPPCLHLHPAAKKMLASPGRRLKSLTEIRKNLMTFDPLAGGRTFQYAGGVLRPIRLDDIRKVDAFYGFATVRRQFREQFNFFLSGRAGVPLLISSLPGHGKTQLTIAHAAASPEITLITADGEVLSRELPELLARLAMRPDRKFVVFFDDLEPDKVDFYAFRTHVGGTFTPPGHVMLALASNFDFPPSILSRGISIQFPTFDDVRCQEMVEDFLNTHGFHHPNRNLISLIAARYTEAFGQKEFTELSPRTLIRYLSRFEGDAQLRKDAVELSCGQLIPRPDDQLFYEFNIRLMRKLYGNEYIENLLKDRLKAMEG